MRRLATGNGQYITNVLGIKDPIHKQKIMLKAMDVVLFGPPKGKAYIHDTVKLPSNFHALVYLPPSFPSVPLIFLIGRRYNILRNNYYLFSSFTLWTHEINKVYTPAQDGNLKYMREKIRIARSTF